MNTEGEAKVRREVPRHIILERLVKAREALAKKRADAKSSGKPFVSKKAERILKKQQKLDALKVEAEVGLQEE